MTRVDTFSLVIGLLLAVVAGAVLWTVFVGDISWSVIKVVAPLVLVVVGVTGLALSRRGT